MNFNTDKMAKSLGLPSKSYLNEMKKQCPILYGKLQNDYDHSFAKFFNDTSNRLKSMAEQEIDIKKFIETCMRNFEEQRRIEKETTKRRLTLPFLQQPKPTLPSSPRPVNAVPDKISVKRLLLEDPSCSEDELVCYPSESRAEVLEAKVRSLEQQLALVQIQFNQAKIALTHQTAKMNELRFENDKIRKENQMLKKNCICQNIEQMILKRKRVDQ